MKLSVGAVAVWLVVGLGPVATHAQHTPAAKFDLTKPLTLTGTVTQIDWANPYVHVLMKVPASRCRRCGPWNWKARSSSRTTAGASRRWRLARRFASRGSRRATAASRCPGSPWS